MIVIAQDTTFSGPEKLVRRWFESWHGPDRALGGVAVFGCPLPGVAGGPRRRVDALVWTPAHCTVVEIAGLRRSQSGILDTSGRWRIGSAPADLDLPVTTPDPAVRAAQAATALRARLRRAGLPDTVAELAVLVTAPGSAVSHPEPLDPAAPATVVAGSADPGALERYFRRHRGEPVGWSVAALEQAFADLGLAALLPGREALRHEGFAAGEEAPEIPAPATGATGEDGPHNPAQRIPVLVTAAAGPAAPAPPRDVDRPPWLAPIPPLPERPREPVLPRPPADTAAPPAGPARDTDDPGQRDQPERDAHPAALAEERSGDTAGPSPLSGGPRDEAARPVPPSIRHHDEADHPSPVPSAFRDSGPPVPPARDRERDADDRHTPPQDDAPHRATTQPDLPRSAPPRPLGASTPSRGVRLTRTPAPHHAATGGDHPAPPLPRREFTGDARPPRAAPVPPPAAAPPRRFDPGPEPQPLRRARHYSPPPSRTDRALAAVRAADWPSMSMSGTAALLVVALLVAGFFVVVHTARANRPALGDYAAMCEQPRGFDTAAEPAPGPVGVYAAGDLNPLLAGGDPALRRAGFPDEVQWVACAARTGTGETVQTCHYPDGSTLALVPATYLLEVFEAGTGRSVHRATVPGEWFAPGTVAFTDRCASAAGTAPDQPGRRFGRPAPDRLHDFLTDALGRRPLPS